MHLRQDFIGAGFTPHTNCDSSSPPAGVLELIRLPRRALAHFVLSGYGGNGSFVTQMLCWLCAAPRAVFGSPLQLGVDCKG